ncbi:WD-40 repeat-containing protein MSI4 isoform X2 [Physcomitrium patens]|uniref:WD-40 repeat-containing protein MSI4 isoform X2 n=1 Tax=Physcomitrium patens TaxID=3218 RepID=UPI000D15222B|nr:WD-40 repeat-containing protein MSI4-like isoform X2 [Physcomitrium patens]|eukprot:XP_024395782.1 WD-40 repeat-containing protein MSI4-like isoform X2 [Physcomitrella patens]
MKKVPEDRYAQWKLLVPALYDWLTNHHLMWPSLSCRWGPQLEAGSSKTRQLLFYSERTDGECPNTIVVAQCDIMKPRTAAAEQISQFKEGGKSPHLKKLKTIIHPGEVNRIREIPQNSNILATHTDSPKVLIWNTKTQPNRATTSAASESKPDLVLIGHTDNAEFALNVSRTAPYVISGGRDKCVLLWSIEDHITTMQEQTPKSITPTAAGSKQSGTAGGAADTTNVYTRGIFKGHTDTVEDVQFRPSSVGDDSCLLLWDARTGYQPISKVVKAHNADLHCVDWNAHDENLILTGSADNSVRLFDHRKILARGQAIPVEQFEGHSAAVLCVQWCPDRASVFGSCAEDGLLNVWDYEKVGKALDTTNLKQPVKVPPGLFFQHTGHRDKVVDFHWDSRDPWTIVSVSEDANTPGGGGTLQIWRMIDFIYRPEDEVLAELDEVRPQLVSQNTPAS